MTNTISATKRRIRSFVRREGRITHGQRNALEKLWPRYGIEVSDQPLNFAALFNTKMPVTVEIGFGNGASLAEMAKLQPDRGFIGIEVYKSGVGQLLQHIERENLSNIRVINADAIEVLTHMIPQNSIQTVQLFFPDPWPKKRHHKRRIVCPSFLNLITSRLQKGGLFHMATDWENYAIAAAKVINAHPKFENQSPNGIFVKRPAHRPETKFERRGQRLGHGVWDLMFKVK